MARAKLTQGDWIAMWHSGETMVSICKRLDGVLPHNVYFEWSRLKRRQLLPKQRRPAPLRRPGRLVDEAAREAGRRHVRRRGIADETVLMGGDGRPKIAADRDPLLLRLRRAHGERGRADIPPGVK